MHILLFIYYETGRKIEYLRFAVFQINHFLSSRNNFISRKSNNLWVIKTQKNSITYSGTEMLTLSIVHETLLRYYYEKKGSIIVPFSHLEAGNIPSTYYFTF